MVNNSLINLPQVHKMHTNMQSHMTHIFGWDKLQVAKLAHQKILQSELLWLRN